MSLLSVVSCQWSVVSCLKKTNVASGRQVSQQLTTDDGQRTDNQTRRFFGGRQPLCGSGVTSSMALIDIPAAWSAVIADSRPEPGPFTRTSISLTPNLLALSAHVSAARWAANGVLLREPLKPTVPADAKQSVSPFVSVIVTIVLLNVALMWATPRLTLRRCLRFLLLATDMLQIANRAFLSRPSCPLPSFAALFASARWSESAGRAREGRGDG